MINVISQEDKMCNNNNQATLWRESLNSDGHHFPLSLVEREKTWLPHMTLEIQVLTWDRHKHVLMCYFPNFWLITLIIVNYSTCGISYFFMQYGSLDKVRTCISNVICGSHVFSLSTSESGKWWPSLFKLSLHKVAWLLLLHILSSMLRHVITWLICW
jgi:hypothetical protein